MRPTRMQVDTCLGTKQGSCQRPTARNLLINSILIVDPPRAVSAGQCPRTAPDSAHCSSTTIWAGLSIDVHDYPAANLACKKLRGALQRLRQRYLHCQQFKLMELEIAAQSPPGLHAV